MSTAERIGMWIAIGSVVLTLMGIAFQAGQLVDRVDLLREDYMGHEQQWLQWLMQQRHGGS